MNSRILEIDARRVRVTDPDERMWSDSSLTRADLMAYYLDVAGDLLPCLTRRPASAVVKRSAESDYWCFQRGAPPGLPAWIPRCRGWDERRMSSVECPVVEERAALAHLVNAACLSFHPWNVCTDALDRPDRMVFNLDPTEIGFREVRLAALLVRDLLARHHVRSWVKTSGGSGLHVMVPLRPTHGFDEVHAAAAFVSRAARAREPKLFTGEVRPSRRRGRIRIDVERNHAGAALASAFSVRADAPLVSMPVEWHELERALYPEDFPLTAVRGRLDTVGNPWRTLPDEPQSIEPILALVRGRRPASVALWKPDATPGAERSADADSGRGR
jgi:DNA ligase D-like protein (predicted polymerase)